MNGGGIMDRDPAIEDYREILGGNRTDQLLALGSKLAGRRVVHVNSTRYGGGVAELLGSLVPLQRSLGIDASWEVIDGTPPFFEATKQIHNALQGADLPLGDAQRRLHHQVNADNLEQRPELKDALREADLVVIHDPQPVPLIDYVSDRRGKWIWRCHIDLSRPQPAVWDHVAASASRYDASVFSLIDFARPLDHPQAIVPPGIDPLSIKNRRLDDAEIRATAAHFGIDVGRPLAMQVSRYDRFKDPVGVIQAFRLARRVVPELQLVLCGGEADDDPEGAEVLDEVRRAADGDPGIHILLLGKEIIQRTTNALQWLPQVMLQKSTREGFGLTVTEAMWKGKPVIGGRVGGIRLQVRNHRTGFVVSTPEGAAMRIAELLKHPGRREEIGRTAHAFVREHFLITRLLRDHLSLYAAVLEGAEGYVEVGG